MGIGDGFSGDELDDFLDIHGITFETLVDTPELAVTSHYGIEFWSQFRMLDTDGNRVGNQPAFFDPATARRMLAHPDRAAPAPWIRDLTYLAGG